MKLGLYAGFFNWLISGFPEGLGGLVTKSAAQAPSFWHGVKPRIAEELSLEMSEMEVMPDHVHMLLEVDPQLGIHKAVKRIKGRTSHDLRQEFPWLKKRLPSHWTNSYFLSAVGGAPLSIIKQYIQNQKSV